MLVFFFFVTYFCCCCSYYYFYCKKHKNHICLNCQSNAAVFCLFVHIGWHCFCLTTYAQANYKTSSAQFNKNSQFFETTNSIIQLAHDAFYSMLRFSGFFSFFVSFYAILSIHCVLQLKVTSLGFFT